MSAILPASINDGHEELEEQAKAISIELVKLHYDIKLLRFFSCFLLLLTSLFFSMICTTVLYFLYFQTPIVSVDQIQIIREDLDSGFGYSIALRVYNPNNYYFSFVNQVTEVLDSDFSVSAFYAHDQDRDIVFDRFHVPKAKFESDELYSFYNFHNTLPHLASQRIPVSEKKVMEDRPQKEAENQSQKQSQNLPKNLPRNLSQNLSQSLLQNLSPKNLLQYISQVIPTWSRHSSLDSNAHDNSNVDIATNARDDSNADDDNPEDRIPEERFETSLGIFTIRRFIKKEDLIQHPQFEELSHILSSPQTDIGFKIVGKAVVRFGLRKTTQYLHRSQVYYHVNSTTAEY